MPCFPSCIATEIRCTLFSDLFITSVKDIKVYKFYATCTNYYSNRGKYVRKWNFQVREEVLIFDLTFLVRVITDWFGQAQENQEMTIVGWKNSIFLLTKMQCWAAFFHFTMQAFFAYCRYIICYLGT